MDKEQIKKLSEKNFSFDDLDEIKKNYEISFGRYENFELKKAIDEKKPFFIKDYFIIGYNPDGTFVSDRNDKVPVERLVKAVIVEDEKEIIEEKRDPFVIIGKNQWESPITDFFSILGGLKIGEIFLPPHSAVFNFLQPTEKEQRTKIVSCLEGVNVNLYSRDNYIDNAIHEIGHLFWRDCVKHDEKIQFKKHFDYLKPAAIYEYEWEKSSEEEVFCTIYKWYIKSVLINSSFYNILEFEDKEGCELLQKVFDRIGNDKLINDIFELNKDHLYEYLNPKFDITTGKKFVKKGLFEKVKDLKIPDNLLTDIDRHQDGVTFINLNKAKVPVKGNEILWEKVKQ